MIPSKKEITPANTMYSVYAPIMIQAMVIRNRGITIFTTLVSISFFLISETTVPVNAASIKKNSEVPLCIVQSDLHNPVIIITNDTIKARQKIIFFISFKY